MNAEQKKSVTSELEDLETALVFLREAAGRTENLKNDHTKQGYPDIGYRIERIASSINRFQPKADAIRKVLRAEEIREEEKNAEKKGRTA